MSLRRNHAYLLRRTGLEENFHVFAAESDRFVVCLTSFPQPVQGV